MAPPREDLLLRAGTVVTMDPQRRVIRDGAVLVRGGRIAAIGSREEVVLPSPATRVVDAPDGLLIPGLVNTHTHLFQTLLKGLGDDRPLYRWLRELTMPAAVALDESDCEAAALAGAVEAIRSGTTTLVDFMYVHPRPFLADAVIAALKAAGVRATVARGFITRGEELGVPASLIESASTALADTERLASRHNSGDGLVRIGVAPTLLWMVDEDALRGARELANTYPMLITYHLAETSFEVEFARSHHGGRETEHLARVGTLGPDFLAVHCTKLDGQDIRILQQHDVKVSHNPVSNMYLASGVPPVPDMLAAGLTVGLATDGPASNNNQNMVHVLKFAALLQKVAREDPLALTAPRVLEMATIGGARAIGLGDEIGSIEVGKRADLALMAFDNPFVTPVHDPVSALVYAALGSEARWVVIDGALVMADGQLVGVDEEAVRSRAQDTALDLARRAGI